MNNSAFFVILVIAVCLVAAMLVVLTANAYTEVQKIYEIKYQIPQENTDIYKFNDGQVSCYVAFSPVDMRNGQRNLGISCIK